MPLELQIIRAAEFIQVGAHGQFDLATSKAALAALAGACRTRGIDLALLDLREVCPGPKPVFTPADLATLVSAFPEVGFGQNQRLAILYQSDPHKRVRLFAFLSSMHGWNVRAFSDFEKAVFWLSSNQMPAVAPEPPLGKKRMHIRMTKTAVASSVLFKKGRKTTKRRPNSRQEKKMG